MSDLELFRVQNEFFVKFLQFAIFDLCNFKTYDLIRNSALPLSLVRVHRNLGTVRVAVCKWESCVSSDWSALWIFVFSFYSP